MTLAEDLGANKMVRDPDLLFIAKLYDKNVGNAVADRVTASVTHFHAGVLNISK